MKFWEEWLQEEEKQLHKAGNVDEIFRCQGRIEVLKRALEMLPDMKEYSRNKMLGQTPQTKERLIPDASMVMGKK